MLMNKSLVGIIGLVCIAIGFVLGVYATNKFSKQDHASNLVGKWLYVGDVPQENPAIFGSQPVHAEITMEIAADGTAKYTDLRMGMWADYIEGYWKQDGQIFTLKKYNGEAFTFYIKSQSASQLVMANHRGAILSFNKLP